MGAFDASRGSTRPIGGVKYQFEANESDEAVGKEIEMDPKELERLKGLLRMKGEAEKQGVRVGVNIPLFSSPMFSELRLSGN